MRWLDVPAPLLSGLIERMPMFEAEESLLRATEIALGSGRLSHEESGRVVRAWRRSAAGPQRGPTLPLQLTGLGIPIVKVPADG